MREQSEIVGAIEARGGTDSVFGRLHGRLEARSPAVALELDPPAERAGDQIGSLARLDPSELETEREHEHVRGEPVATLV